MKNRMTARLRQLTARSLPFVVAVVTGVAGWQLGPWLLDRTQPALPARNIQQLAALTLPDLHGQPQALAQWQGQVLVVNLWAAWCPPCRAEMPGFSRLQDKYAGRKVQFVGIALDTAENVVDFVQTTPVRYPLLIGSSALLPTFAELGNSSGSLPFTAVFDAAGQLRHIHRGYWREGELDDILGELAVMMTK